MAKKKTSGKAAAKKKKAAGKTTKKKAVKKKAARKRVAAAKKTAKKKTARKKAVKRKAAKKKPKRPATLGRPKFTGEAPLDEVFKEDYHARQIFTFLGVSSLKELEKYAPEEIVDRLAAPLVQTVQQIRKRLADNNRHLAGDLEYALQRKSQRVGK